MGTLLTELGYTMSPDDRFKLYLTNTLDVSTAEQNPIPGLSPLADESHMAEAVKTTQPVLVIMGNPPYSGTSSNKGAWISALINDYKQVDGKPLGERNSKMLQDDYVKFIRFAQWKIDQAGEGVLGFITNHSYLDNPTFRGMRQSLMTSFDQLHVLNLHGSSLKREKSPDGSKDENVFDIRQGVAIVLADKRNGIPKGIWYSDLWGSRDAKYGALSNGQMAQTAWQELVPRSDAYLFVPKDETLTEEYEAMPSLQDVFEFRNVGLYTSRDALTVHFEADSVWQTVVRFVGMSAEDARIAFSLPGDVQDWKVSSAQEDLRRDGPRRPSVTPIAYRPFDRRYTYYTGRSNGFICRPRPETMSHMLQDNLALVTCRQTVGGAWQHALVAQGLVDNCLVSNGTKERGYVFPLYLYDVQGHHEAVFGGDTDMSVSRRANVKPEYLTRLISSLGDVATPENVFAYIYAILYSLTYRERYAGFLKADFPRIPFTKDRDTFLKLAELGQQLIVLHLMRSPELDNPISRFCGKGDSTVNKVEYDADRGRVSINPTQYFDGVTPDLWAYQIGGYQVLAK